MAIATLVETHGARADAMRLIAAAESLYNIRNFVVMGPADPPDFLHVINATHARLADPIFAAAWAEGQVMTLKEAIAYALALDV